METTNLEALTDKIYSEAIEKAEEDAGEIIKNAQAKSEQIIKDAREEAQHNIINKATKDALLLKTSTESELQLKGKQLISDLKREISNLISNKILDQNIKDTFLDTAFFKKIILEVVQHWSKEDVIELHLPENTRDKIDKQFQQEIGASVKDLTITYDDRMKGGFRIAKTDDSYQISFTDEDFISFFQTYLNKKTKQLLFDDNA